METISDDHIIDVHGVDWLPSAVSKLQQSGVIILRWAISQETTAAIVEKSKRILARPAISGSVGYYMKDPNKKLFDCLLLGPETIAALTSSKLIDVLASFIHRGCWFDSVDGDEAVGFA